MKIFLTLVIVLFSNFLSANTDVENSYLFYKVRKGDDLGSILYSMGFRPIWGLNGYVKKVTVLNNIKDKGNLLFYKTMIQLPKKPPLVCNISIEQNEIKIMNLVSNQDEYENLLKSHLDDCSIDTKNISANSSSVNKSNETSPYGKLKATSWVGYSKISGTDNNTNASGEVFSNLNKGISLEWEHIWNTKIITGLFIEFEEQSFQKNPGRILVDDKNLLSNFGFTIHYIFNSLVSLTNKITYGEDLFLFSENNSSLRFDIGKNLKIDSSVNYRVIENDPFTLMASLGLKATSATDVKDYKSEDSFGYFAQVSLNQKLKKMNLIGSLGYENMNKDTTEFKQNHQHLRLYFGVNWRLE